MADQGKVSYLASLNSGFDQPMAAYLPSPPTTNPTPLPPAQPHICVTCDITVAV